MSAMAIKPIINRILQRILKPFGYKIIRRDTDNSVSIQAALSRVFKRGVEVETVIDIGASNGMWTKIIREYLPDSHYLLVEANPVHEPALKTYVSKITNASYQLVAAGAEDGHIYFDANDPFGGVASYHENDRYSKLPMRSIDSMVEEANLSAPYLLKLDTHGFEVPIFEGAIKTLEQTNVIVVEVYNFRIASGGLLFNEMCDYLAERGFRVIDLYDPLYRKYDQAFWQADFIFIRSDRDEFKHKGYH